MNESRHMHETGPLHLIGGCGGGYSQVTRDLVAALDDLLQWDTPSGQAVPHANDSRWGSARAAIAKAKGQA